MGDAIRIEQRLHDLFAGRRHRERPERPGRETPREMEQRAMERLYGEHRSTVVVRAEQETEDDGA